MTRGVGIIAAGRCAVGGTRLDLRKGGAVLEIKITSNLKDVLRRIDTFTSKQLPFAMAQAINATAVRVQAAEQDNIKATFDNPTPFTQKSVGVSLSLIHI